MDGNLDGEERVSYYSSFDRYFCLKKKDNEEFWTQDIFYQSCESLETGAVTQHINCTLNKSRFLHGT